MIKQQDNSVRQYCPYGYDDNNEPYGPNPTQTKILKWVNRVRAGKHPKKGIPVLFLRGGVGSGKTRGIMAPVGEMLMEIPGLRVLWGRQDLKDLKLSVMDKFFSDIISPDLIVNKSSQYNWYDIKTHGNGAPSRIYFNGLKDLSGFGSQEFGVVVITEAHETSEMAYRTLKRRLRQEKVPVMMLIESEPPNENHWSMRLTNSSLDEYDKDITMWELSTYENWENLQESYKHSLESMPKSWQRKYLYGKAGFIPDGRPFYEGFREEIHAGNFDYNRNKTLHCGWDFGYHHPAFVVSQIDDMGRWYILKELLGNEITIDNFCVQVQQFLNAHYPGHELWDHFGDPACMQVNDKSEKTSWQICQSYGFNIKIRQSTYRERKETIDGKLSKMINGKPTMQVDFTCRMIIDGLLGGYHYPERKPGQQNSDSFEVPYRDGYYEHIINALEYIAVNLFTPIKTHKRQRRIREAVSNAGIGF